MNLPFAERMNRVTASPIMELLKSASRDRFISFASGLPNPLLFPKEVLRSLSEKILRDYPDSALQYGPAEGITPLREWVAQELCRRGLNASVDNVLITHGSQQAIDLVARAFLNTGDKVALENPTYLAALQAFDSYQVQYHPLPMDEEGVIPESLEELLKTLKPKLLFLLPNFQNPTGLTLSLARRTHFAELIREHSLLLLEDDAYYDLRYEGEELPPLSALAEGSACFLTGTFSKTIAPGLRVGWLYGPAEAITRIAHLKQITDLHTSTFAQHLVLAFLEGGFLPDQVHRLRKAYRAQRNLLLEALQRWMSPEVSWTRPSGGMFLLLSLPQEKSAEVLLNQAMKKGVLFVPGTHFYPLGGGENTLRLNFVSPQPEQIEKGIQTLAETINSREE